MNMTDSVSARSESARATSAQPVSVPAASEQAASAQSLSAQFEETFGRAPAGVWEAPGRANFIGEHTDYNDGFVLPFALPYRTSVAAAPRTDRRVVAHSPAAGEPQQFGLDGLAPGDVTGWASYVAGMLWSLEHAGYEVPGMDLLVSSDVPIGAGLSSSAALECAVGLAARDLGELDAGGDELAELELARLAQAAENEFVGMPCGLMDQAAAMCSKEGHLLLFDTASQDLEHIPVNMAADEFELLIIDTRAPHRLVDGAYAQRRRECVQAADELGVESLRELHEDARAQERIATISDPAARRRARHVVGENHRVIETVRLLRAGDVGGTGAQLSASHASLRDDFEVTVPELDVAADTAVAAGALGARMMGGGFGGCVIALIPRRSAEEIRHALRDAFAEKEFTAPDFLQAMPAAGARRVV